MRAVPKLLRSSAMAPTPAAPIRAWATPVPRAARPTAKPMPTAMRPRSRPPEAAASSAAKANAPKTARRTVTSSFFIPLPSFTAPHGRF